ncbi:hypothetical protein [Lactovum odontotermitis]
MGLISEITDSFSELKGNISDVQEKLTVVQDEAEKAQKVGLQIQRKVEEFQFSAQGNIDKINEIASKYAQPEPADKAQTK